MTTEEAIQVHLDWKRTFAVHVAERRRLDDALMKLIQCEDECALGKWIVSAELAGRHARVEFFALKSQHSSFHRQMMRVAAALEAESYTAAEQLIAPGMMFDKVSAKLTDAIVGIGKL
jgi:hypothetical protein